MAAATEIPSESVAVKSLDDSKPKAESESESEFSVQKLVDMFTKLNPLAKEFFPSSYAKPDHRMVTGFPAVNKNSGNESALNNRRTLRYAGACCKNRGASSTCVGSIYTEHTQCAKVFNCIVERRNNFNQARSRLNGRSLRAQREDSIRRTVYVSDIDQNITEEQLAALFSGCGQVVDCRVCGDPHSVLRFAFVEFADEYGARTALALGGTMLGFYPVRVLPSKTAILPVNPTFLPRSDDEREMCSRTVYCTNIDKNIAEAEVKNFFESACGEVTSLRLLGDQVHSTRIGFVEFAMAESAIVALSCSGMVMGSQPIRVSPSKTPVRPRVSQPTH